MSAQKNKLSADFTNREKKSSVVQRFITEEERPPEQTAEITENIHSAETAVTDPKPEPKEPKSKYYLINTMEDVIIDEVAAVLKHMRGICKCEKCFYDICAVALNAFPALYATSEQGELFGKASSLLNADMRGRISAAVFDSIDKVQKTPAHSQAVYDNSALTGILRRE